MKLQTLIDQLIEFRDKDPEIEVLIEDTDRWISSIAEVEVLDVQDKPFSGIYVVIKAV